jgi:outer membrane lipoprotein-sorting protein
MNKNLTVGLAIIFAAAVALTTASPKVNAQGAGLVSSIFNKMERNRRDLRSLRASISMEKYNAQIRDSDKRSGTVAYIPGAGRDSFVRVDWRSPVQEILSVAGGEYTLFSPRRKTAWVGSTNSKNAKVSGVLGFGLNATSAQMKSAYDVKDLYNETLWGGVATTHMTLVPKGVSSQKYSEIWVDGSGMPVQTKVVEKNGDSTTVRLMDIQRNVQVSKGEFKLDLGSDVKKVRG